MHLDRNILKKSLNKLIKRLLDSRTSEGYWQGRLSSSALSTATAVFALGVVDKKKYQPQIQRGLNWLCENSNTDGGWGDTPLSISNISTTMLCWSAFVVAENSVQYEKTVANTEKWLIKNAGSLEPEHLLKAVNVKYGKDRSFSSPILTMCALAGRLNSSQNIWKSITPLPFELAVMPHRFYKILRLPVVSYALPALIAVGQLHFHCRKPLNPVTGFIKYLSLDKTFNILTNIQPENGGFLEAVPLTSFVIMTLAAAGKKDSVVVKKGLRFLLDSVRKDGSWPIDTNLATWVTTLSINALAANPDFKNILSLDDRKNLQQWLLSQQHRQLHHYTNAAPGGWAWTNSSGAVPDADDTAGALLALHNLHLVNESVLQAVNVAIKWLLDLQNKDGGIPTFCRGWNKLPFDRSSPDITAHTIAALALWLDELSTPIKKQAHRALDRALDYLARKQNADGTWYPLWFGNQLTPQQQNPLYGTAKVLTSLSLLFSRLNFEHVSMVKKAVSWLLSIQNSNGGWGAEKSITPSIEETALALDALAALINQWPAVRKDYKAHLPLEKIHSQALKGASWLIENTENAVLLPSPIGLYFARLWYFEKLYPYIFTVSALSKIQSICLQQK
jgi:squalene-hopene/tetraprenyl-beta-curcumene cyclase